MSTDTTYVHDFLHFEYSRGCFHVAFKLQFLELRLSPDPKKDNEAISLNVYHKQRKVHVVKRQAVYIEEALIIIIFSCRYTTLPIHKLLLCVTHKVVPVVYKCVI